MHVFHYFHDIRCQLQYGCFINVKKGARPDCSLARARASERAIRSRALRALNLFALFSIKSYSTMILFLKKFTHFFKIVLLPLFYWRETAYTRIQWPFTLHVVRTRNSRRIRWLAVTSRWRDVGGSVSCVLASEPGDAGSSPDLPDHLGIFRVSAKIPLSEGSLNSGPV